jgi:hypothetical protein
MSTCHIDSMPVIVLNSMSTKSIHGAMVEGQGMKAKLWN